MARRAARAAWGGGKGSSSSAGRGTAAAGGRGGSGSASSLGGRRAVVLSSSSIGGLTGGLAQGALTGRWGSRLANWPAPGAAWPSGLRDPGNLGLLCRMVALAPGLLGSARGNAFCKTSMMQPV
jgi:hypothetical protein